MIFNFLLIWFIIYYMKVKKIAIISLSSGILGENFIKHEIEIGLKRLNKLNIEVVFLPNSLKGIEFIKNKPEERAKDLLTAFLDPTIDMILCAIGGFDTYKTIPYLFEKNRLKKVINKKIFLGFSDTTINHFYLNKLGLNTFYGQAFLTDVCELSNDMLPYTKNYFLELINTSKISKITPSNVWYMDRKDYSINQVGIELKPINNTGFELINGSSKFSGKILGGCLESIYSMLEYDTKYKDQAEIIEKYEIFPKINDFKKKILLLETSETKSEPDVFRKMIKKLNNLGIFNQINGLLFGKPQDEVYFKEYKKILKEEIENKNLPIVCNINIGHSSPRCIIPFGVDCEVDVDKQEINFLYPNNNN